MRQVDFPELSNRISGEVFTDNVRRGVYATDASIYQKIPQAVVFPRTGEDVAEVLRFARENKIPLLARGGGTSLAGQAVTTGIVMDFTKYMNQVIQYDPNNRQITVQPGITRDEVNTIAGRNGLEFAPDPATSSRATIGGMVANNSSGTKSILYGKTIDHVIGLKVLLADGTVHDLSSISVNGTSGTVFDELRNLTVEHQPLIEETFPKTMRRVNGYCLDELIENDTWHPHKVFIGSEGTLGVLLEITIKLVPLPVCKSVAVVHFKETIEAVRAVETMLKYNPAAVEILSSDLINYSKKNISTSTMTEWVRGEPESVQIVEFYGDTSDDIESRAQAMFATLKDKKLGYAFDIYPEGDTYNHVWSIRKRGLGLLMGEPNDQRGIAFIEDAAIPVEFLPEYIERVLAICEEHEVDVTYYAHASVGVIHVRPILDMRSGEDIEKMKSIARQTFDLVKYYGGAWSGEHGDGLVRSSFLPDYFGQKAYNLLVSIKRMFDPDGILNPGVIIDTPRMDTDLRYGTSFDDTQVSTEYQYREQHNFNTAVHQCTGIGSCRKVEGGTMCPSYMVTKDDLHSTRGRANALRLAMSGQLNNKGLTDPKLMDALDLCLSCKACKAECPSSVDMARLKSEVLQKQYDTNGTTLRDRLIRDSAVMASKFAGPLSGVINSVQRSGIFRTIQSNASLSTKRSLPEYARESFSQWFKKHYHDQGHQNRIGLFADTYLNYHEPAIGRKAVEIIQALGYDIDLFEGCCQRPRISHGFLRMARAAAIPLMEQIDDYDGIVLSIEPGCTSALRDDLPDLTENDSLAEGLRSTVVPIGLWLADKLESQPGKVTVIPDKILLHGHCHQKALDGTGHIHRLLKCAGAEVFEPDSGCCGMGGSFGYEKEHYEVSKALANRFLIPAIESHPEHVVAASGFSCRHQIDHFAGVKARHWIEMLKVMS